jgi:hypothetical protein
MAYLDLLADEEPMKKAYGPGDRSSGRKPKLKTLSSG